MMRKLLLLLLLGGFISACSSDSNETSNQIDYATLDTLQTEVALEIGETEDYLPGQLRDLVVTSNGSIVVSDWSSVTVEQFDENGNHMATVAKEGGGPGELSNYFFLRDIGSDTLMAQLQSGQKNFYALNEEGIFQFTVAEVPEKATERPVSIIGPASNTTYYATTNNVIRNVQEATKNEHDYTSTTLVEVSKWGDMIADSLHQLQRATAHLTQIGGGGFRINSVPYRNEDHFVLVNDQNYFIARTDSNTINFYDSNQQLQRSLSLNVKPRPVTDIDLEYHLEDLDSKIRNEIEMRMHENKPPYLNVWATDNCIWLHTDTGKEGKQMVVLDYDGNPVGKFMLPEVDSIEEIKGNKVYTIHRSPEQGNMIRAYQVNI